MMTITDLIHQLLLLQYLTEKRHVYWHLHLRHVVHLVVLSKLFVVVPIICDYFLTIIIIYPTQTQKNVRWSTYFFINNI